MPLQLDTTGLAKIKAFPAYKSTPAYVNAVIFKPGQEAKPVCKKERECCFNMVGSGPVYERALLDLVAAVLYKRDSIFVEVGGQRAMSKPMQDAADAAGSVKDLIEWGKLIVKSPRPLQPDRKCEMRGVYMDKRAFRAECRLFSQQWISCSFHTQTAAAMAYDAHIRAHMPQPFAERWCNFAPGGPTGGVMGPAA